MTVNQSKSQIKSFTSMLIYTLCSCSQTCYKLICCPGCKSPSEYFLICSCWGRFLSQIFYLFFHFFSVTRNFLCSIKIPGTFLSILFSPCVIQLVALGNRKNPGTRHIAAIAKDLALSGLVLHMIMKCC